MPSAEAELNVNSVAVDGAGLSESTYELISGHTDSESQDGTYAESLMTGSVESLDMLSRDDAASEHVVDEESVVDEPTITEAAEEVPLPESRHDKESQDGQETDEAVMEEEEGPVESEATLRPAANYTQQSLGTPSLTTPQATPEASTFLREEKVESENKSRGKFENIWAAYANCEQSWSERWNFPTDAMADGSPETRKAGRPRASTSKPSSQASMSFAILREPYVLGILAILMVLISFVSFRSEAPARPSDCSGMVTTTVIDITWFTTAKSIATSDSTTTTFIDITSTTTAKSIATSDSTAKHVLVPLRQVPGEDSMARYIHSTPMVKFSSKDDDSVVINVEPAIPPNWLHKNCASIDSTRDGGVVVPNQWLIPDHNTIVVNFPASEAYGTIEVTLKAGCRPRFEKAVKVRFSKRGVLEKVFLRAQSLSEEIQGLVPIVCLEAQRNYELARASWEQFSLAELKDDLWKDLAVAKRGISRQLNSTGWQRAHDTTVDAADIARRKAQLAVLEYQVQARIWWLRMTEGQERAEQYKDKAKVYTAMKEKELARSG